MRVVKDVLTGALLIGGILLVGYLILGFVPSVRTIPIVGPVLPQVPTSLGDLISKITKFFWDMEILEVSRDSGNNLLVTIENTGNFELSNFTVYVDENEVDILNEPKDPLKADEITTIQTDWENEFSMILVYTPHVNATFPK
jgi:hypothetical protein